MQRAAILATVAVSTVAAWVLMGSVAANILVWEVEKKNKLLEKIATSLDPDVISQ